MANSTEDRNDNENRDDRLFSDDTGARARFRSDITDPQRDQDRLKPDEATINLPEVRDIPGQEHIHVPALGELADTTISSDDEEGVGLLDELNGGEDEDRIRMGSAADVTATERQTLERGEEYMPTRDEENLSRATMDNTDFEGEPLNTTGFGDERTGRDLDTSGVDEDDKMEDAGAEDEENNEWSSDKN
ncbi:MAG TPA: hypothetical protein VGD17_14950 [Chitinophagaceae bacterium]